jgi:hypothetical protein
MLDVVTDRMELVMLYWQYMLKGYEWFPKHNTAFKEPTVG